MIEPQSMHDGASAWVANATLVPPRLSVIPPPLAGLADPLVCPLACPFEWPFDVPTVARYPSSTLGAAGTASEARRALGVSEDESAGAAAGDVDPAEASASGVLASDPPARAARPGDVEAGEPAGESPAGAARPTGAEGDETADASTLEPRSIRPRPFLSSSERNREPIHRKM